VVTAADGLAASALIEKEGLRVLVPEVVMPNRSGPKLFESLAEHTPPVLFTSGMTTVSSTGCSALPRSSN